jgi:hypothetical protein
LDLSESYGLKAGAIQVYRLVKLGIPYLNPITIAFIVMAVAIY